MPLVAASLGLVWGFISDRIAARWPAHEGGRVRPLDWRTPVVTVIGGAVAFQVVSRFGDAPSTLALLAAYGAALTVLFATDLDQRLLPDVITLPLILFAILAFVTGIGPFVRTPGDLAWAVAAAIGLPLALYLLSIPFGAGAIGIGDLKLLVSVGLLAGAWRLIVGVVLGAILAAVVIVALLALRRITLRTYIPYGPFLILGALWAILRALA